MLTEDCYECINTNFRLWKRHAADVACHPRGWRDGGVYAFVMVPCLHSDRVLQVAQQSYTLHPKTGSLHVEVVNIIVLFWVLNLIRHQYLRYPKRDPSFDNHPCDTARTSL